ncbi:MULTISPECIES: DNA gyrase/topoisomerase IV subunit A [Waltera]|jgi:DNA topoisomerase IV subunit A parC|uniref:DNA gyrase/topoisomerase IV subunit A n=1 Tax=Waltera TaxID=2815781 RepID=UPI001D076CFC|nr:DNA topoisomerase (ATP-hydrolyzing) [Brotolimicola acetigignens]MCB6199228.1 DNA topoisomerase 4 subunit A [Lacrimispora saccharolytica]MCG4782833.1 DNA topoisomerase 4 subunit A [Acetatifactor sp. DFI.5.50]MCU6759779.1 DNA topoisomerase 4 subunit A [Brotolimicola acetigignens]
MDDSRIIKTEYSEEMQKSFIDYAMSVIIARALPDVRDGLKPVQRRTLYDMHTLGIRYDRPYRKSARIVGDTMGKYHPHGDSSIYEALVVMSQDFKKGMPLIDGHGNFGNIEGDGAAAMRYTEARLQKVTQEAFLADLDKDVVDFVPNFDETEKEPSVLPVKIPNLLVNGSEGIAVGMATSIPPHNLGEVIDAVKAYMLNNEITTKELMRYLKGPDFPTGGIVINKDELEDIYETGTGKIKLRGKVEFQKGKAGKTNVVITEIPYTMIGANIAKFLSDVAALSETKKTQDIVDISNQSSKEGIRIVIELRKDADPENFVNMLYKKTRLEDTFGVNMLAIANGRPETMGLKQIIKANVDFQFEVATRKYTNLLAKEQERKEIQEGLIKACNVIDLVIEILRGSKDRAMAKACLVEGKVDGIKFKSKESRIMAAQLMFTEKQANAILEMRLYKLIGLELEALINEHEETMANIYRYEDILDRRDSMAQVIMNELDGFKKEYSHPRKTVIENGQEAVYKEKELEEMDVVFLMDRFGYAKTVDVSTYERNKEAADAENKYIFTCKNTGRLCLFTTTGQMHTIKVLDLPYGKFRDKGTPIDNVSNFSQKTEEIVYITSQKELNLCQVIFATAQSMLKVVDGGEFDVTKRTVAATKLAEGDSIVSVTALTDQRNIVLQTKAGFFLRFAVDEIPEKKKGAIGVRGMKLGDGDQVENVYYTKNAVETTIEYKGKELVLNNLKLGKRDSKGTKVRV